jgi:hypothetical protein
VVDGFLTDNGYKDTYPGMYSTIAQDTLSNVYTYLKMVTGENKAIMRELLIKDPGRIYDLVKSAAEASVGQWDGYIKFEPDIYSFKGLPGASTSSTRFTSFDYD